MKRFFRVLVTGALAAALTATAYAADFTHCADSMKAMGLFAGTNKGYELDRAATRAEAGVMLVRLLGREAEAKATAYDAPFTDVPDWAKPYVGWLYRNGLTAGVSGTKYGTNDTVTAQQYATFLLRALGYSDRNGDFAYADALRFAEEKGVADGVNCDGGTFLRDEVVAMSYTALSRPTRAGTVNLLTELTQKGAVSESAASNYLLRFRNYSGYEKACEAEQAYTRKSTAATTDLVVNQGGQTVAQTSLRTESACIGGQSGNDTVFSSVTRQNGAVVGAMYYADGTLYRLLDGETEKQKLDFASLDYDLTGALPVSLFGRVQASGTVGGVATYTLTAAPALADRIVTQTAGQQGFTSLTESGFSVDKLVYTVGTDASGVRNRCQAEMGLTTQLGGKNAGVTIRMDSYLTGVGDSVTVSVPEELDV